MKAVGWAEQNSNGRHGLMYFDIVLRYQLLGTSSAPSSLFLPPLLTKASLLHNHLPKIKGVSQVNWALVNHGYPMVTAPVLHSGYSSCVATVGTPR